MAQGFECRCGKAGCRGWIDGARRMGRGSCKILRFFILPFLFWSVSENNTNDLGVRSGEGWDVVE